MPILSPLASPRLAVAGALGVFALPALFAPCQAQDYGDQLFTQAFAIESGGHLVVDLSSEDVILETADGPSARVAVFARGRNAGELFEQKRFSATQDGRTLRVKTEPRKQSGWDWGKKSASFTIVISIPQPFDLSLDLSSGDVTAGRLAGGRFVLDCSSGDLQADALAFDDVVFDASSGDFEVGQITASGSVSIDVSSGDATIGSVRAQRLVFDASSGDLQVGTADVEQLVFDASSGELEAGQVSGEVVANTSSGDVELGTVGGRLVADTSSGSVRAMLTKAAPVAVDTGSGSVTLTLARGLGADLRADGGSLRIDSGLGFAGSVDGGRARGPIGGGGPPMVVNTGSGSIRIQAQ